MQRNTVRKSVMCKWKSCANKSMAPAHHDPKLDKYDLTGPPRKIGRKNAKCKFCTALPVGEFVKNAPSHPNDSRIFFYQKLLHFMARFGHQNVFVILQLLDCDCWGEGDCNTDEDCGPSLECFHRTYPHTGTIAQYFQVNIWRRRPKISLQSTLSI